MDLGTAKSFAQQPSEAIGNTSFYAIGGLKPGGQRPTNGRVRLLPSRFFFPHSSLPPVPQPPLSLETEIGKVDGLDRVRRNVL